MPSIVRLQERIAALLEDGASLNEVETGVIRSCGLDRRRKAVLHSYAAALARGAPRPGESPVPYSAIPVER